MSIFTFNRRQFLRSTGGFILSMPFLPSLAEKGFAQTITIPRRLVSIRSLYGQPPELFYPTAYRPTQKMTVGGSQNNYIYYRAIPKNQIISDLLGTEFQSISHKLSILRGLDVMGCDHNQCMMLSPGYLGKDGKSSWPTTFDEMLATSSVIYPNSPTHRILRIEPTPDGTGYDNGFSFKDGINQPYEKDLNRLFSTLFKKPSDTSPTKQQKLIKAVDLALAPINSIKQSRQISSVDKLRLDQFVSMLNDVENKIKAQQITSCEASAPQKPVDFDSAYDLANDISILALSCGLTQIVSLSLFHFTSLPGETGSSFHDMSHWVYGNDQNPYPNIGAGIEPKIEGFDMSTIKRMWSLAAKKAGKLMTKMDSVVESNGKTMLDNSLVFWGNESGGASSHGSRGSMPVLVGGTLGDKVVPGYWDYTYRPFMRYAGNSFYDVVGTIPYTNFLTTLANLYEIPSSFYEKENSGGFGDFSVNKDDYTFNGNDKSVHGSVIYAEYLTTAGKRKLLPGWVKT